MARFNSRLDHVRVAAPCSADWDAMIGNDRARFCGQCNLNVYNLSSMTKAEAETFIAGNEGRLCVRFYRRADGSILTENCPVGLRAIRRKMLYFAKACSSAILTFFAGVGLGHGLSTVQIEQRRTMGVMARDVTPAELNVTVCTLRDQPVSITMGRVVRASQGQILKRETRVERKATRHKDKPKILIRV